MKKSKKRKTLVVDASIMRAAGEIDKKGKDSQKCREFLMGIRSICHRVAVNSEILTEWDKHQSAFSRRWRVSMVSIRKIVPVAGENEGLRDNVRESAPSLSIANILLKDIRLIEAAVSSDRLIFSLDEAARMHFADVSVNIELIGEVGWINPCLAKESVVRWMEAGADHREHFKLRYRKK